MSGKPASTNHVTGSAYSMRRCPTFRRAWRQALVISSNERGKCSTLAQSKLLTSAWLIVEATLPCLGPTLLSWSPHTCVQTPNKWLWMAITTVRQGGQRVLEAHYGRMSNIP